MLTLSKEGREFWEHKFIIRFGHKPSDTSDYMDEDFYNLYQEWLEDEYAIKCGGV